MAKGIIGGMTDYSHQSFDDILTDLNEERKRTSSFRGEIVKNVNILKANSYWESYVPFNFKCQVEYAIKHYDTVIVELKDIHKDINNEVKEHHVKRLQKISTTAQEKFATETYCHTCYDHKNSENNQHLSKIHYPPSNSSS